MVLSLDLQNKIRYVLEHDGVISFVTDTVWGLGCLPESEKAVKKIYEIKGREKEKPLILMSDDTYPLLDYIQDVPKTAQKLMKQYFPGALTVVVPKSEKTPDYITSGLSTVGVRVPDNEVFGEICRCIDSRVLASTSANLSHEPAALSYQEAVNYIGDKADLVIEDFGYTAKGLASTVIGFKDGEIIVYRQGEIKLTP